MLFAGTVAEYDDAAIVTRTGNAVVFENSTHAPTGTVADVTVSLTSEEAGEIVTTAHDAAIDRVTSAGHSAAVDPANAVSATTIPALPATRLTVPWSLSPPNAQS